MLQSWVNLWLSWDHETLIANYRGSTNNNKCPFKGASTPCILDRSMRSIRWSAASPSAPSQCLPYGTCSDEHDTVDQNRCSIYVLEVYFLEVFAHYVVYGKSDGSRHWRNSRSVRRDWKDGEETIELCTRIHPRIPKWQILVVEEHESVDLEAIVSQEERPTER